MIGSNCIFSLSRVLACAFLCFAVMSARAQSSSDSSLVVLLQIEDQAITPVTQGFIDRVIAEAEESRAQCVIIALDTPGGLMESTRKIVKRIIASEVPIVVYVYPSGARAASAGLFVTLSAHVAAMAPGTHIGAAHPVQLGGLPGSPSEQPVSDTTAARDAGIMEEKVLNDAVAWVRSLADMHGRNADWAELAVTESKSIPEDEALEINVVDIVAKDVTELLLVIDGRPVELQMGPDTLRTQNASISRAEMWWGEKLLGVISNPNIAFLLIIFGFYGILFELYSPGWGVGGTVGIICLLSGFFALAILPVNYTGLALIILALAMFVAEVFITSYGALTFGGVICLILGGVMLIDSPFEIMRISFAVLIPVALATAGITFFLLGRIVAAHRKRVLTGSEGLIGVAAFADADFLPDEGRFRGFVKVHGELWKATCGVPVTGGQTVWVTEVDGLTLGVTHRKASKTHT
ncbi:MAG: nodulation protein NfeD [Rhodothermales bacterium]|nr:nodulation protein NfeD [Rhodothermales bacterium]